MIKPLLLFLLLRCLATTASAGTSTDNVQPMQPLPAQAWPLYIGTYSHNPQGGICGARFDSQTGELCRPQTLASTPSPSFLAASPDGRFLFAVNEWGQVAGEDKGGLSAFRIDPATAGLSPLSAIAEGGTLCHLSVDATGKWLLVAAYSAGTASVWPLKADGSIGPRAALVQHAGHGADENRQSGPHAHHIVLSPDNRRAFVADLGLDKVMIYGFNAQTGALVPAAPPFVPLASGAGPRHLALTLCGRFLYVVSELNNTITAFKNAPSAPRQIQVLSTLPAGFMGQSFTAEIAVHPDGRFLYVSNRGHNSLACYTIEVDGQLQPAGFSPTGRGPRHFTFDPGGRWLLTANQTDRSVTVSSVDLQSGALTPKQHVQVPDEPTCLLFGKP